MNSSRRVLAVVAFVALVGIMLNTIGATEKVIRMERRIEGKGATLYMAGEYKVYYAPAMPQSTVNIGLYGPNNLPGIKLAADQKAQAGRDADAAFNKHTFEVYTAAETDAKIKTLNEGLSKTITDVSQATKKDLLQAINTVAKEGLAKTQYETLKAELRAELTKELEAELRDRIRREIQAELLADKSFRKQLIAELKVEVLRELKKQE